MGNTEKKITRQIAIVNNLVSRPRFKELTGLKLNFALILRNPIKVFGKVINTKEDFRIQVNFIDEASLLSEIGTVKPDNFSKIVNIINHLLCFTAADDGDEDSLCGICLEVAADTILECGHQFCLKDLQSWELKNQECPLCRQNFAVEKSFVRIEGHQGEVKEEVRLCKEEIFKLIDF